MFHKSSIETWETWPFAVRRLRNYQRVPFNLRAHHVDPSSIEDATSGHGTWPDWPLRQGCNGWGHQTQTATWGVSQRGNVPPGWSISNVKAETTKYPYIYIHIKSYKYVCVCVRLAVYISHAYGYPQKKLFVQMYQPK